MFNFDRVFHWGEFWFFDSARIIVDGQADQQDYSQQDEVANDVDQGLGVADLRPKADWVLSKSELLVKENVHCVDLWD